MRFSLDQVLTYQDMNEISQLWAAETRPPGLGIGECWLDISGDYPFIKRYNGSDDDVIGDLRYKDKTSGNTDTPLIQCGRTENGSLGTISFDVAYTDTPRVIAVMENNGSNGICWVMNVTTTGFQTKNLQDGGDGGAMNGTIQWIAIGRG